MIVAQTSSKKHKHRHLKRKNRSKTEIDFGTPKIPLSHKQPKQKHELLSDWEDAP